MRRNISVSHFSACFSVITGSSFGGVLIREEIFAGESGDLLFNQRNYFLRHLNPAFVSSRMMPIAMS